MTSERISAQGLLLSVSLAFLAACGEPTSAKAPSSDADAGSSAQVEKLKEDSAALPAPDPDEACGSIVVVAYAGAEGASEKITRDEAEAAAEAERRLERVHKGETMLALAAHSDETRSRDKRGGMGTFTREKWPQRYAQLADPLLAVEVGEFTPVIKLPIGFAFAQRCAIEKVHTRHILVRYAGADRAPDGIERSREVAEARAGEALAAVKGGEDFAAVAKRFGDDGTIEGGGDLGEIGRGMFVSSFEDAAFALEIDGLAPVVESKFGFHVIQRLAPLRSAAAKAESEGVHAMRVENIKGEEVSLGDYAGKVLLIVNTASECGFTNQYTDLQKLHAQYAEQGLVVLGFPSNDFGAQEPGTEPEIEKFVHDSFGVEFPMFAKVHAKGDEQDELYRFLTHESAEHLRGEVKWNFTKFLIDPQGKVVSRFEPKVEPMAAELREAVEALLPSG